MLMLFHNLWGSHELAELRYYQEDIDDCIKVYPSVCRHYTRDEIEVHPDPIKLHMLNMNIALQLFDKFKYYCAVGITKSRTIISSAQWYAFSDEYFAFDDEIEKFSTVEIETRCLEYCGIFLAKPELMNLFCGDKKSGEPYFKAITDPIYKYLKKLQEDIQYYSACIGTYNDCVEMEM